MMQVSEKASKTVITLQPQQREQAAAVIARAFKSDPLLLHLTRDPVLQDRMLHWFGGAGIKFGERYGRVYTTPAATGVAVWFLPGQASSTPVGLWLAALWLPLQVGWTCFWRFLRLIQFADRVHRGIISGDHWHLFILAVAPEHQGQGLGSELLQPVLAQADARSQACYLETTNPQAVPFYLKHGFEIVHQSALAPRGTGFWTLLRKPAPIPGAAAEKKEL